MTHSLEALRQDVQAIDRELVRLFADRMRLVLEIGRLKITIGVPMFDASREREVISHALQLPHYPLDAKVLEELFLQIVRIYREAQIHAFAPETKE
jgi:chorismate mutase